MEDNYIGEPETTVMGKAAEKYEAKEFMYQVFKYTCGLNEELSHFDREFEKISEETFLYIIDTDDYFELYNRVEEKANELNIDVDILLKKVKAYLSYMFIYKTPTVYNKLVYVRYNDLVSMINVMLS